MKNLKIFTNNIDAKAIEQIDLLLDQDAFKNSKIRIMPDVHAGKGCVIGFTGDLVTLDGLPQAKEGRKEYPSKRLKLVPYPIY